MGRESYIGRYLIIIEKLQQHWTKVSEGCPGAGPGLRSVPAPPVLCSGTSIERKRKLHNTEEAISYFENHVM